MLVFFAQTPLTGSDLATTLEIVRTLGIPGALLVLAGWWLTRSLIPKLQADAEVARTSFSTALDKVVADHAESSREHGDALRDLGTKHEIVVQKLIDACADEKDKLIDAIERAHRNGGESS